MHSTPIHMPVWYLTIYPFQLRRKRPTWVILENHGCKVTHSWETAIKPSCVCVQHHDTTPVRCALICHIMWITSFMFRPRLAVVWVLSKMWVCYSMLKVQMYTVKRLRLLCCCRASNLPAYSAAMAHVFLHRGCRTTSRTQTLPLSLRYLSTVCRPLVSCHYRPPS
jgi:hypothetical protein